MRHVGRLLRLSLGASAPADAAAGLVLGFGAWPTGIAAPWSHGPWLLPLASACVFHGGMALNDWADREHDARTRPERPIPSGAVSAPLALGLGLALLALGLALTRFVHPEATTLLGAVVLCVLLYDLGPRGPWTGPLLLGLCRAGNLGAGVVVGALWGGDALAQTEALHLAPAAYGLYVFLVSRLGRLEDGVGSFGAGLSSPRVLLVAMALLLLVPAAIPLPFVSPGAPSWSRLVPLALGLAAAVPLVRRALVTPPTEAAQVPPVMGMALRRLLVFTAATAALPGTPSAWVTALVILAGFPLSHALRRIFPPS